MTYREGEAKRRPLVILNSIDLPVPPSVDFCEAMWAAGYQVVFCRRPGFGKLPGLPAGLLTKEQIKRRSPIATEAALFNLLFKSLGLKNIVLLGLGTSNPICYRLAQMNEEVTFTVYANPLFHPAIWDVIRPDWLKRMIRQTVKSRSGLKIAVRGLRAVLRRDPIWFYHQFAQKSAGDLEYIAQNTGDFRQAGQLLQRMAPETFFYDLQNALIEDTHWNSEITKDNKAVILSGLETTSKWKRDIAAEAMRLNLPIVFAKSGDLFVAYASHETLLDVLSGQFASATSQSA